MRTSLPTLLSLFAFACAPDAAPDTGILALTEIAQDSVIAGVAEQLGQVQTFQSLDHVSAIAVDFARLGATGLDAHRALLRDARAEGIPLLVQGVEDGELLAEIVGIGLAADLAYIEPARDDRSGLIQIFDQLEDGDVVSDHQTMMLPAGRDAHGAAKPVSDARSYAGIDPREATVDDLVDRILDFERPSKDSWRDAMRSRSLPEDDLTGLRAYYVDFVSHTWTPDGQPGKASIDQDFWVHLAELSGQTRPGRYVTVSAQQEMSGGGGAGFVVHGLAEDDLGGVLDDATVGSFQDQVQIRVDATLRGSSRDLSIYENAPRIGNRVHTYTSTTTMGGEVTGSAEGLGGGFSFSREESRTHSVKDFEVHTEVEDNAVLMSWEMRKTEDGDAYRVSEPHESMVDTTWGGLLSLPAELAYGQMSNPFEVVYRADTDASGRVAVHLRTSQRLTHAYTDSGFFSQDYGYTSRWKHRSTTLYFDISDFGDGTTRKTTVE